MDIEAKRAAAQVNEVLDEMDNRRATSMAGILELLERIKIVFDRRMQEAEKERAAQFRERMDLLESERDEAASNQVRLRESVGKLEAELAACNARIEELASLNAEYQGQREEWERLRESHDRLQAESEAGRNALELKEQAHASLDLQWQEASQALEQATVRVSMLEEQAALAEAGALSDKTALEALRQQLAGVENALTLSNERVGELQLVEETLRELRNTLAMREEALALAEGQVAALKSENEAKEALLNTLREDVAIGSDALTSAKKACENANNELDILRADHHAFSAELETMREECDRLRMQLQERDTHIADLNAQLESASAGKGELEEARLAVEEKDKRIGLLEQALHDAAENCDRHELQAKMLLGQLESLQFQQGEMEKLRARLARTETDLENERAAVVRMRAQLAIAGRGGSGGSSGPDKALDLKSVFESVPLDAAGESSLSKTRRSQRKLFGEILFEAGVVSREQLEEALRFKASDFKRRIGSVFIELGYATAEVIAAALAAQLRLRYVDNLENAVKQEVISLVPSHLVKNHRCVPLSREGDCLQLAMENPLDLIAIENIELASNCRVEPVVATPNDIDAVIARFYTR